MKKQIKDLLIKLNSELNFKLIDGDIESYTCKIFKKAKFLTIFNNHKLEAFIAFYDNDINKEIAFLSMLAVDENSQGQGYGKILLEASFKLLRNKGFKKFDLEVDSRNLNAIKLYESFNFIVIFEGSKLRMRKDLFV